jgi:hypothetical protein
VIGAIYTLPDGRVPEMWLPCKTGEVEKELRTKWQVEDRICYQTHSQKAIASTPELDAIVETLRQARRSLGTTQKRVTFDAWLLEQIGRY